VTLSDKAKTATDVVHVFLWTMLALDTMIFVLSMDARSYVGEMAMVAHIKSVSEKGVEFDRVEMSRAFLAVGC
jgi:hypothetical protein